MAQRRGDASGTLTQASKEARKQDRILKRQRADCRRLAEVLKTRVELSRKLGVPDDAKDLAALTRSTDLLHQMERRAHDFGQQGQSTQKTVIIIPTPAGSMAEWHKATAGLLGSPAEAPGPAASRRIEPDIEGELEPDQGPSRGGSR